MVKANDIARTSARGGLSLFWGLTISTIISSISAIFVARLLTPTEYGLVRIAGVTPNLIVLFRDWGINSALIRYIAQLRAEERSSEAKKFIHAGLIFEFILALALTLVSFLSSEFLASMIFQRPEIVPLVRVSSFTVLGGGLVLATESVFVGFERMSYRSITMIFQALVKLVLAPLLIVFGMGPMGAVLGTTSGALLTCLVSILIVYWLIYKKLNARIDDKTQFFKTLSIMLKYGIPLFVSVVANGLLIQFNNLLIAIYSTNSVVGNYSVALNFTVLISFFSIPIASVLFPAFSKLDSYKDRAVLVGIYQRSVRYASLLVVPAAMAMMVLAEPAVSTLFGEKYAEAPLYLTLSAISYLYTAFGSLSVSNFINSRGSTNLNMKLGLVTSTIGFPLGFLLILRIGILGLIAANLISGIPSLIIGIFLIRRTWNAVIDWIASLKIIISSALAAFASFTVVNYLNSPSWFELFIGATIFLLLYVVLIPLLGAVNHEDIKSVKEILSEFGLFSNLFNIPLNLMERLRK